MNEKISRPGLYRGYSAPVADGYVRTSSYVTAFDGCRLAVDLFLPSKEGKLGDDPHPTVVIATGYRRAWRHSNVEARHVARRYRHLSKGDIATVVNRSSTLSGTGHSQWIADAPIAATGQLAEWLRSRGATTEYLLIHGYAILVVDVRGTGASFGKNYGDGWQTGSDVSDVIQWAAAQSWCNGAIGMLGSSWLGATQYFAMTFGAPQLKAVVPQMASFDVYESWFPGGVYLSGFLRSWSKMRQSQDSTLLALPIDADLEGVLLAEAVAQRNEERHPTDEAVKQGRGTSEMTEWSRDDLERLFPMKNRPLRGGGTVDLQFSALDFARATRAQPAVYLWGGWWDLFPRGVTVAFWNLVEPKKLLMGPWHHANYWDVEETHRWFDYWLKGIENGIMKEPRVIFSTSRANGEIAHWSASDCWPPSIIKAERLQFHAGPSGTVDSVNDGRLLSDAPPPSNERDVLSVDYTATAGTRTRAYYSAASHLDYSSLYLNDRKGLTYTSDPLTDDLQITGYPSCRIWLTSTSSSGILVVYLEEIDPGGQAHAISEAVLNLQFRDVQPAPIETGALAYRSFQSNTRKLLIPGEVMEIVLDFMPTSSIISRGHRVRVTVQGADADNYYAVQESPAPILTILHGEQYPSYIELPIAPSGAGREGLIIRDAFRDMPQTNGYATRLGSAAD